MQKWKNRNIYALSIDDNIDIYNPKSGYYNDLCYFYKTDFGTDICLKDRREEFINKNLAICEEICEFKDYNYINLMANLWSYKP